MNPLAIAGVLLLGGGILIAVSSDSGSKRAMGLPTDERFKAVKWQAGLGRDYNGIAYVFDGKPLGADDAVIKAAVAYIRPKLDARRATLPSDATFHAGDKYSSEAWWFPYAQTSTMIVIDEYGRSYDLDYGQAGMWANLWANPLFKAAVFAALAASGYGVVGYAALQAYQLRGSDLSLKDVALKAARGYIVSQCGPPCGAAFDMGVGVVSGQSVDEAAEQALVGAMTPEQREAYDQGKEAYQIVKQGL